MSGTRVRRESWAVKQVLVLDGTEPAPTYHRVGDATYNPDLRRHQWYTKCGHALGFRACWLSRGHADKFAAPCMRCYPEDYA